MFADTPHGIVGRRSDVTARKEGTAPANCPVILPPPELDTTIALDGRIMGKRQNGKEKQRKSRLTIDRRFTGSVIG